MFWRIFNAVWAIIWWTAALFLVFTDQTTLYETLLLIAVGQLVTLEGNR